MSSPPFLRPLLLRALVGLLAAMALALPMAAAVAQTSLNPGVPSPAAPAERDREDSTDSATARTPRLRQPNQPPNQADERTTPGARTGIPGMEEEQPPLYVPGEFERFVQQHTGLKRPQIRRFGADLVTAPTDPRAIDVSPLVPEDYVVAPGDEVLVTLWGSVDADLRLLVDRSGRISIPRVGTVQVSGLRMAELPEAVNRRVAQVFRNFQSSVALGQLRGIRIFVTGFVVRPGTYSVSSLSSVVTALMRAGGPSAAGSFRNIELRRGAGLVSRFDLYDLLLNGDRSADRLVQAGDVVHVGAVGAQVGFIGSVNKPAVLELKPGETVSDALGMVGGFAAVADRSRLAVERLQDRNLGRVTELALPRDAAAPLSDGDVLRALKKTARSFENSMTIHWRPGLGGMRAASPH